MRSIAQHRNPQLLPALLLALFCTPALAQSERWYRVELLVFSQGGAGGASQEYWNPEPELQYPAKQRFLVDPQRVEHNEQQHPGGDSEIDPRGRQIITFADPETRPTTDIPHRSDEPARSPATAPDTAQAALTSDAPEEPLLPDAFTLRSGSELKFRGKAAYMERHGSYQTLFHHTWLQPMASESRALPIALDHSGDDQAYPALQGSVKLYLSRYLHIETNLWLNTRGDYLRGDWRMPAPPLGPASLVVEEPVDLAAMTAQGEQPGSEEPVAGDDDAEAQQSAPPYPYRHAVLLQQSRRMRSNEVHYIDHPMLGVVVQLSPLSEEDLEQLATADTTPEAQSSGRGE